MSNIYVPIDFSDLKNVIPEGQEILYSTYAEVKYTSPSENTGRGLRYFKGKWESHVLITAEGLALNIRFQDGIKQYFVPLFHTSFLLKNLYVNIPDADGSFGFSLLRRPEFEKKDTFKKRSKEFKPFIKKYRKIEFREWISRLYPLFQSNPDYSYYDYTQDDEYPMNKQAFKFMKKRINAGKTLEELLALYMKFMGG